MDPTVLLEILIEALQKLLANCPQPAEQKRRFLRSPGILQRLQLSMELRRQGLSRADQKAAVDMAEQLRKDASDADIDSLIEFSASAHA